VLLYPGQECKGLLQEVNTEVSDLNLYDILEPCYRRDGGAAMIEAMQKSTNGSSIRRWPLGGAIAEGDQVQNFAHVLGDEAGHPPCLDHRWAQLCLAAECKSALPTRCRQYIEHRLHDMPKGRL